MKYETFSIKYDHDLTQSQALYALKDTNHSGIFSKVKSKRRSTDDAKELTEILLITSYPPMVGNIATYSQDLITALHNKFSNSFSVKVCALESGVTDYKYPDEVKYILNTSIAIEYEKLASAINNDNRINIVLIQHNFDFYKEQEQSFLQLICNISKPVVIVFHTVLPVPDESLKSKIRSIAAVCDSIIVMTHNSAEILMNDYGLSQDKIAVIAHGTHLVAHVSKEFLKKKYGLVGRQVLTSFGLLRADRSIETAIEALPAIINEWPEVVLLIIGKTHPEVKKTEGEKYRERLEQKVERYGVQDHVLFINKFLALPDLLEYLQLTDIYLITTNDPNQASNDTFSYAMSCACPIISTPIPHAREILTKDTGIIFDFLNSQQLSDSVIGLLNNKPLRKNISSNTMQKIVSTAWENSAISHALLFEKISSGKIPIRYNIPDVNLNHLKHMTIHTGIIQFSTLNQPDFSSGYTLDDNARALIAMCMHYKITGDGKDVKYINQYLRFIKHCKQPDGSFLNYVDKDNKLTTLGKAANIDDSNGRAVWALGYVVSLMGLLAYEIVSEAITIIKKPLLRIASVGSSQAMAFTIKGLYYYHNNIKSKENLILIKTIADRLVRMYRQESDPTWEWFESDFTHANSILPEALLYAWLLTGDEVYKGIALSSLNFLLLKTFNVNGIEVISTESWLNKGRKADHFSEKSVDIANSIMTLSKFYEVFGNEKYRKKMVMAFDWFLGNNRLHQIIYNPCTGASYDGIEGTHVNLNQAAESSVSYLMARLTMEKYINV